MVCPKRCVAFWKWHQGRIAWATHRQAVPLGTDVWEGASRHPVVHKFVKLEREREYVPLETVRGGCAGNSLLAVSAKESGQKSLKTCNLHLRLTTSIKQLLIATVANQANRAPVLLPTGFGGNTQACVRCSYQSLYTHIYIYMLPWELSFL